MSATKQQRSPFYEISREVVQSGGGEAAVPHPGYAHPPYVCIVSSLPSYASFRPLLRAHALFPLDGFARGWRATTTTTTVSRWWLPLDPFFAFGKVWGAQRCVDRLCIYIAASFGGIVMWRWSRGVQEDSPRLAVRVEMGWMMDFGIVRDLRWWNVENSFNKCKSIIIFAYRVV